MNEIYRSRMLWSLLSSLLMMFFLAGCPGGENLPADAGTDDGVDAGPDGADSGEEIKPVDGYGPASSWVGWLPMDTSKLTPMDEPCPSPEGSVAGWKYGRLFSSAQLVEQMGGLDSNGNLNADGMRLVSLIKSMGSPDELLAPVMGDGVFCLYEWTGKIIDQAFSDSLKKTIPLDDLDTDPVALVPLDDGFEDLKKGINSDFWAASKEGLGAVDLSGVSSDTRSDVVVAVLDSSVTDFGRNDGLPGSGQLLHGRQVGLLIRALACPRNDFLYPTGSCRVKISDFLVLDREPDGMGGSRLNRQQGGFFGTPAGLARMIWWSVIYSSFLYRDARTVINMSVGWETGPDTARNSLPVQAVKTALSHARCKGALLIAAAGNSSGGSGRSHGPMGPALFEDYDWEGCPLVSASEPMIYSVGGVDATSNPLANSRAGAQPSLAAYSYQVTIDEQYLNPGKLSDVSITHPALTGSSMAAAAGSAFAAVAWSYRPGLDATSVMQNIYESGLDIGKVPDYCMGSFCQTSKIHRISLCLMLEKLNLIEPKQCPPLPSSNPGWSDDQQASADSMANTVVVGTLDYSLVSQCGQDVGVYYDPQSGIASDPCPDISTPNYIVGPQLVPQPRKPVCPTCTFIGTTLYLGDVVDGKNHSLLGGGVSVFENFGLKLAGDGIQVYFDLQHIPMSGQLMKLQNLPLPAAFVPSTAQIVARMKGYTGSEFSLDQQIPLVP